MYSAFGFGLNHLLFSIIPIIVALGFIVVFGILIAQSIQGGREWHRNNQSPVLTVDAVVIAKRANISHHHHSNADNLAMSHTTTSTTYYVTFQVESGDRMEFRVRGSEYGMLIEGDAGRLTFQGTRYLNFTRT